MPTVLARDIHLTKTHSAARQRAWSRVLPLILVLSATITFVAWQGYRAVDREVTEAALSKRSAIAYLMATVLDAKFDHLIDLGLSLSTRVRFHQLVMLGKWKDASEILRDVPRDFPFVSRLTLHDPAGTIMADWPPAPDVQGQNFSHRDWYKGVVATGKPYISQIYTRAALPALNVFSAAIPIRNERGSLQGILVLQLRADAFFEWIKRINVGSEGLAYVVDRNGRVAAHPQFKPQAEILDYSTLPAIQRVLKGERSVEILADQADGVARVVAFEPVTEYGWGVVFEESAASVFKTRRELQTQILLAYGVVLGFLILGAFLISQIYLQRDRARVEARAKAELELRVTERTALLEAANQDLESFSYTVSHDLKAPVRAIGGFAQMLQTESGGKLDTEGVRMLRVISDNSNKLGRLIEGLLEFARLGRMAVRPMQIDMAALVAEVIGELRSDPDLRVTRCEIGAMPHAWCDPLLMSQVWTNLLANAIKFSSRRDDALIEVGGSREGAEYIYHVKDNGAGFDMSFYKQLFGVFHRLHSEKEFRGTGIGLAIVQRVVHRHGGRIWAESKVGEGATFYFALPVRPVE